MSKKERVRRTEEIKVLGRYEEPLENPKNDMMDIYRDSKYMKPGDNAFSIAKIYDLWNWEKNDRPHDVEYMEDRFQRYLVWCAENEFKISNQMCYLALDVDGGRVRDWALGKRGSTSASCLFYKKVLDFLSAFREFQMIEGKLNPILGIWWQKNYDGFVDNPIQQIEAASPFDGMKDVTEISDKYSAYFEPTPRRDPTPKLSSSGEKLGRPITRKRKKGD